MIGLIEHYGVALVFANVLIQQIGLPIPVVPTLIVAGALAADGKPPASEIFAVAFTACAISDTAWYVAGRLRGRRVLKLLCQISLSPDSCVQQSEHQFRRWGRLTLILAKFVPGMTMIMPSLAGMTGVGFGLFVLLDGLGAAIWTAVAIGSGMLFHREVGHLIAGAEEFGAIAVLLIGMLLGGYIATKWWQRRRFRSRLRMARISVDELHRLIAEGKRTAIVDLRSSLVRDQDSRFIPGAVMADFADVDRWLDRVPMDREVIFYCTCPNETGAAQVARKLMDLGYTRVRPLLGGLDAWIAAGYQVESRPAASAPLIADAMRLTRETVLDEVDSLRLQHAAAAVKRCGSAPGA